MLKLNAVIQMTEPIINVGIVKREKLYFDFYGDFFIENSEQIFSGKYSAFIEGDSIIIEGETQRVKVEREIVFEPSNFTTESFLLRNVVIGVDFHWEQKENQRFLGNLKLIKKGNELIAINIISIESYLTSVISSEMSSKCSINLLKAQSIISRSWLLAQLEKNKSREKYKTEFEDENELIKWYDRENHVDFDVCADDHCQRYQGITKIHNENVKQAIEEKIGWQNLEQDDE